MACTDLCHDCGEPLCENQCTCQVPDYSNIGECNGVAEITNCVNYSGNDDSCLAIAKPIGLTSVLQKMIAYIKNIFNRVTSDSLVVTTPTSCDDLVIELVPSVDAGNILTLGTDGYPYVPTTGTPGDYAGVGNDCLLVDDGDPVNDTLDTIMTRLQNAVTITTSDSLLVTRGTVCNANVMAVELVPSVDANNILILGVDGLPYVPAPSSIAGLLTAANNGLHLTSTTVKLGGALLEDTTITGSTFFLSMMYSGTDFFKFTPTLRTFNMQNTSNVSEIQTADLLANICSLTADYNTATGYLSQGMTRVQATDAIIGFDVPIVGSATPALVPKTSSYLQASAYTLSGYANEVLLTSPLATITSGPLILGKTYKITVSSGGFDAVAAAGAANNSVGTSFISNGVTPTWGTGAVTLQGDVTLTAPRSSLVIGESSSVYSATIGLAAPYDTGVITISQPGYSESHLYQTSLRISGSPGYICNAQIAMHDTPSLSTRSVAVGVSVPVLVGVGTLSTAKTQYTSTTDWINTSTDVTTQGMMRTYSPYVSFRGIPGVNGEDTKMGINVALPTNPLHINNTADIYPLRLENPKTPASAAATGVVGEISWDATYVYICISTNTWHRILHSTW